MSGIAQDFSRSKEGLMGVELVAISQLAAISQDTSINKAKADDFSDEGKNTR